MCQHCAHSLSLYLFSIRAQSHTNTPILLLTLLLLYMTFFLLLNSTWAVCILFRKKSFVMWLRMKICTWIRHNWRDCSFVALQLDTRKNLNYVFQVTANFLMKYAFYGKNNRLKSTHFSFNSFVWNQLTFYLNTEKKNIIIQREKKPPPFIIQITVKMINWSVFTFKHSVGCGVFKRSNEIESSFMDVFFPPVFRCVR